jgi:hypothetical protein
MLMAVLQEEKSMKRRQVQGLPAIALSSRILLRRIHPERKVSNASAEVGCCQENEADDVQPPLAGDNAQHDRYTACGETDVAIFLTHVSNQIHGFSPTVRQDWVA